MLASLRKKTDLNEPEPVSSALHMATFVRSQIFTREVIDPAAKDFIQELSDRLDQVPARRHAVDFEVAKAQSYWKERRTDELIGLGRKTLAQDPEIQRAKKLAQTETIVFDRHLESLLKEEISTRLESLLAQMNALRENRLNVQ